MVSGRVSTRLQAIVPVAVVGPGKKARVIQAVLDTGFTGDLVLPALLIEELGLPFVTLAAARLASGALVPMRRFEVRAQWMGAERSLLVLEAEGGPLAGMRLMHGCRLTIEVVAGGIVQVTR